MTGAALDLAGAVAGLEAATGPAAAGETVDVFDDLAEALAAVEAAAARLGHFGDELRAQLAERMPGARAVTSVGVVESVKEGGSTVWDHSKVWPAVYRQARRRADKGFEPVDAALAALREAAPDPAWRASVLAGWGIDVDQVATRVPARRTVKLTPRLPR